MAEFFNLYRHGFVRAALGTPPVHIGDPARNAQATLALMRKAAKARAAIAVFPELGLSAYSCEDLFHQRALLRAAEDALVRLLADSRALPVAVSTVEFGAPVVSAISIVL